jgi:hypothetical protein
MTDLYYYDLPNKVKIRADKIKADEYWVKDPDSEEYVRLIPGGGELPVNFLTTSKPTQSRLTGMVVKPW